MRRRVLDQNWLREDLRGISKTRTLFSHIMQIVRVHMELSLFIESPNGKSTLSIHR
jgi:hypothetical protein